MSIPNETTSTLEQRINVLERDMHTAKRRLRAVYTLAVIGVCVAFTGAWHKDAIAQGYGVTLAQLATRMTAVETKTQDMTRLVDPNTNQNTLRISNVNVQIVDGTGNTEDTFNGRGNLIIGYNELRTGNNPTNTRTGSHNLIMGLANNYSSVRGIVAGYFNSVENGSSVLGGEGNTASGASSVVLGGLNNQATGTYTTVSGGFSNFATGSCSTVSGGGTRIALGANNWVGGGLVQTE